jgi:predicted GH43/DUF377 family glycosyl hydrolase
MIMKIQLSLFVASSMICSAAHSEILPLQGRVVSYCDYEYTKHEDLNEEQNLPLTNLIDLDKMRQNFVLETKRIEFPEYPGAFNPSIIRWRGCLLMSFRFYNMQNGSTNPFALVWLDENFEPISTPQAFELPFHNPVLPSKQQDPRLISVGERLFVVYNNILENVIHREIRRMYIAELSYDGEKFTASEPECLVNYEGKNEMRYEKNWVPFEYHGNLLLGYSLVPHRILCPLFGEQACETIATSKGNIQWKWGVPKGGTQALLDNDHYIAFFHSWIDLPTVQSNGRKISHYLTGAYTFEAHPPFSITAMSPEPIVADNFYLPPYYKTWKPLRCIFPGGIVLDENYVWISYGRQDHEVWIAKLDKKALMQSLIPIASK